MLLVSFASLQSDAQLMIAARRDPDSRRRAGSQSANGGKSRASSSPAKRFLDWEGTARR